jgi:membrane fusion protein, multidrug efflux system
MANKTSTSGSWWWRGMAWLGGGLVVAEPGGWHHRSSPRRRRSGQGRPAAASPPGGPGLPVRVAAGTAGWRRPAVERGSGPGQDHALQDDAQAVGRCVRARASRCGPRSAAASPRSAFADGARVRKGQLLVQLDDVLQRAELSQAQAQLSIARANLKRNEELVAQTLWPSGCWTKAVPRCRWPRPRWRWRRPGWRACGWWRRSTARSATQHQPGRLRQRRRRPGEPGRHLAADVDFRLPERYQRAHRAGQPVQVQLDALPGKTFSARCRRWTRCWMPTAARCGARGAAASRLAANCARACLPRVTVLSVNEAALVVPEEAIVPQGGKQFVICSTRKARAMPPSWCRAAPR